MTREEAKDTASEVFYASHGLVYPVVAKPYTDDMVVKEKFFTKDDMVDMLDKIRAEIEKQEKWLLQAGYNAYNVDIAFSSIKSVLTESEVEDT